MLLKLCSLSYVLETMLFKLIFPECFKAYLTKAFCTDPLTDPLLETYALQVYALQAMLYKLFLSSYAPQAKPINICSSSNAFQAMLFKLSFSSFPL